MAVTWATEPRVISAPIDRVLAIVEEPGSLRKIFKWSGVPADTPQTSTRESDVATVTFEVNMGLGIKGKLSMDYLSQGSDTRATWLLECSHWLVRLVDRVPGAMQEQLEKNFGEFERACLEQRRSQTQ